MKCKNCGHNMRKHIKTGNSFYCMDTNIAYPVLSCGCTKPEAAKIQAGEK